RPVRGIEIAQVVGSVHEDASPGRVSDIRPDFELLPAEGRTRGTARDESVPIVRLELARLVEDHRRDPMLDVRQVSPAVHFDEGVRPEAADRIPRGPAVVVVHEDENAVRLIYAGVLEYQALVVRVH